MGIGENVGENVGENTGQSGNNQGLRLIYAWNFDDGTWGDIGHGATGGDSDGTSITTEEAHSGTYCAKVDYSGGNNLNHIWYDGFRDLIDRELYVSFWYFHHADFEIQRNHKCMRITNSFNSFNINQEYMFDTASYFTTGAFHVQPSSACGNPENIWKSVPSGSRTKDAWHHFEWYGKLNTNGNDDGSIKIWVDDSVIMDETDNFTFIASGCDPQSNTYKWNTIYMPSNFADAPPGGSVPTYYVDDIQIFSGNPE